MPTLSRWFEEEQDRLIAAGKSALAESFQAFRAAAFEPDVPAVLAAVPNLYALADALGEPVWRLVADYYAIFVECHWRGNVARALELATQASIRADENRRHATCSRSIYGNRCSTRGCVHTHLATPRT
jgi:hypothetical protein